MRSGFCATVAVAAVLASPAAGTAGFTIGFAQISNKSGQAGQVAGQLFVDVNIINNQAQFTFRNEAGLASSITDLYFDTHLLPTGALTLPLTIVNQTAGVNFSAGATPGQLPAQNNANPAFVTTAQFSADSNTPISANGVDHAGESLTIGLTTTSAYNQAWFENAFNTGTLRIGLHVQAIGTSGRSDSFVGGPVVNPAPAPSGLILMAGAVPFLAILRRKRRPTASLA